jgi:hypothetical protein
VREAVFKRQRITSLLTKSDVRTVNWGSKETDPMIWNVRSLQKFNGDLKLSVVCVANFAFD